MSDERAMIDQLGFVGDIEADKRSRAVRAVANAALDSADCALLLDMLGLHAAEGRQ